MDIWAKRTEENYEKLIKAFYQFGMPIFDMTKENFLNHKDWDVFKFGRKPTAIDIMINVKGLDFDECFKLSKMFEVEGMTVRTLHLNNLIQAKKEAGRLKDLDDIQQLTKK